MTFEEWFRKQYGSHQKGFGLCEADLEGAWKAALQHAAEEEAKWGRLGGADWLRAALKRARET